MESSKRKSKSQADEVKDFDVSKQTIKSFHSSHNREEAKLHGQCAVMPTLMCSPQFETWFSIFSPQLETKWLYS
ncbi:hypothetical protein AVEN_247904-1, partial [Araneus ventricosus]